MKLLAPIQEALKEVSDFKDKASRGKEGRQWANHLSTVGEGAGAWGWVAVVSLRSIMANSRTSERLGSKAHARVFCWGGRRNLHPRLLSAR